MQKILLRVSSIAILLFLGVTTPLSAGDHIMVRCEGMKEEMSGCKASCTVKSPGSKIMTLEECRRAGGNPTQVEKMD